MEEQQNEVQKLEEAEMIADAAEIDKRQLGWNEEEKIGLS